MAISKIIGSGLGTINSPVEFTSADNLTQITLSSTDADANSGPNLDFYRNSGSPADNDLLAKIRIQGKNDAGQQVLYSFIDTYALDVTDGTEDGGFYIYRMMGGSSVESLSFTATEAVFNESSKDYDFRVESDGNANMLFVDGGTNTVMIGTTDTNFNAGADNLIVGTGSGDCGMTIYTGSSAGHKGSIFFADTAAGDAANSQKGQISYEQNNEIMTFFTNNSLALTLALNGSATIANGLTLTDGDLVVANTHGINFAATGDGAGTDTSETLHDYEEGTFTPLLSNAKPSGGSVTFSSQIGVYTKIGNVVSFSLSVLANGSTIESSSNEVLVVGLPYDVKNISSQHFPPASLFCDSGFNQSAATQGYIPVLINGTAGIKIFGILSAATSNQNVLRYNELGRGNTTTSFAFRIAGTYRTA